MEPNLSTLLFVAGLPALWFLTGVLSWQQRLRGTPARGGGAPGRGQASNWFPKQPGSVKDGSGAAAEQAAPVVSVPGRKGDGRFTMEDLEQPISLACSAESEFPEYSIGPFAVDNVNRSVTLAPGIYTLKGPLVFGILPTTRIEGVHYSPATKAED